MNISSLRRSLVIFAFAIWGIEVFYLVHRNSTSPTRIHLSEVDKRNQLGLAHKETLRDLEKQYEERKHLATGESVYDRIFNMPGQSITDLITRISREALPDEWSCDIKVEEFSHFVLLIYLPFNTDQPTTREVLSYFPPILKYCGRCLSDVAVFDRTHTSYLFFDISMLNEIKEKKKVPRALYQLAREKGKMFTLFDSITIECEKQHGHLFLPLEVASSVSCYALFDTGATMTTLSVEVVSMTGTEDLRSVPRQTFSTANGQMTCPIVMREINVGGIRRSIEVAANQFDDTNLLGLNFFEGMDYIVDFQNSKIYVWER